MANNQLFIDTGAYLSRFHKHDKWHKKAVETWEDLGEENQIYVTTNHVVDEVATLLGRRTSYEYAARRLEKIYASDILIARPDKPDEKEALIFFRKYADQKISFTDCLSFVVMRHLKIKRVFTFDKKHFEYAGFKVILSSLK